MPYRVEKQGSKYAIVRADTGTVVGHSDSAEMARSSVRARLAGEHGARLHSHAKRFQRLHARLSAPPPAKGEG